MKTIITAVLLALALGACTSMPPGQEPLASHQVPAARIYIQEMAMQRPGLAEVQFSRTSTFLNSNWPVALEINDVVLALMLPGEHMSIWLKPGNSYHFSIKPEHGLSTSVYPDNRAIDLELTAPDVYKVHIDADIKGMILRRED